MPARSRRHEVLLTQGAEHDLESIHAYIATQDSTASAVRVLDQLIVAAESLSRFPDRGSYPKELIVLGIREYRQIMFKPYRIIYRVEESAVFIYVIADGHRDMQSLLSRRLLEA